MSDGWKFIGKEGRLIRLEHYASRMFKRHQAIYERQLREKTYGKTFEAECEMIEARYWVAFAQYSYASAKERRSGKFHFSTDMRWAMGFGSMSAYQFDEMQSPQEAE